MPIVKSMHMGLQSTLSFLRKHGVWIVKARQAVLSVLKDCIVLYGVFLRCMEPIGYSATGPTD